MYFVAGEISGDMHGGSLIRALKALQPDFECAGVGGDEMSAEGLQSLLPFKDFAVMGFSDVILAYPLLRRHFYALARQILEENPLAVVLIDYPGFNLRLARFLRRNGYRGKLIQYVAPSVWAWKKGRIQAMSESLDLLLTIFPFEPPHFANTPLKAVYVGNPLIEEMKSRVRSQEPFAKSSKDWRDRLNLPLEKPLIALFPGSRPAEVKRHLPLFIEAAKIFSKGHPGYGIAISIGHRDLLFAISKILEEAGLKEEVDYWLIPGEERYLLMQEAEVALAKSGTVALELALQGCPTAIAYNLPLLNFILAKWVFQIRLPHYALPNILLNEAIFPEFYRPWLKPSPLAEALKLQLTNRKLIAEKSVRLEEILTKKNASREAAREILSLVSFA